MASSSAESSQETTVTATCLVCFEETAELKIVGPCKHSFCMRCLGVHLSKQPQGVETFPCPGCQQECPLPSSGLDGLDDWSHEVGTEETTVSSAGSCEGRATTNSDLTSKSPCQVCECKDTLDPCPDAEFRCEQCRGVLLCKTCASEHGTLPTTSHHVVTRLSDKTTGYSECSRHHMPLDLFCNSCQKSACSLCVLLEHREHDAVEMRGLLRSALDDTKDKIAKGTAKLIELKQLKSETGAARDVILNWRGRMIQQVEEATERAINRLLEQKEKLKNEIKTGCEVSGMTDMLEKIPEMEESIQKELGKGRAILNEISLSQEFLLDLKAKANELNVVLESDDLERELHWRKLQKPLPLFEENDSLKDIDVGQVHQFGYGNMGTDRISSIVYNNTDTNIESIAACVGENDYALFYSDEYGCTCEAYDHSYKPGGLVFKTLTDGDRFGTLGRRSNGDLAMLNTRAGESDEGHDKNKGMCLSVFRSSEEGYKKNLVCSNLQKAVSFSVNILGQYVLLSNTTGNDKQQIILLNEDGGVIDTLEPSKPGLRRVACGGQYCYILGKNYIEVYEIAKGKVVFVDSVPLEYDADDITATPSDGVFVSVSEPLKVKVFMVFVNGRCCKPTTPLVTVEHNKERNGESRVDVTESWMIVSHAHGWYLYKLKAIAPIPKTPELPMKGFYYYRKKTEI